MFDDDVQQDWELHIQEFKSKMMPIFASFGISLESALLLFMMNKLSNDIVDSVEPPPDKGEEWKGEDK